VSPDVEYNQYSDYNTELVILSLLPGHTNFKISLSTPTNFGWNLIGIALSLKNRLGIIIEAM
jgi:hypothetical protein